MEPIGPWHANIGDILSHLFNQQARGRFRVRVQYPINLGQISQPQPDLVLYRPGLWRGQHPGAADISLVIEISDTSLAFDLGEKLALYKSAGIQEYWVIDLKARQVHRFVAPAHRRQTLSDSISPVAWPDIRIDLTELSRERGLSGRSSPSVVTVRADDGKEKPTPATDRARLGPH